MLHMDVARENTFASARGISKLNSAGDRERKRVLDGVDSQHVRNPVCCMLCGKR